MKTSTTAASLFNILLMALAAPAMAQQAYPTKPVRLIVPFPPGGAIAIVARLMGQKLTESWEQQVIVDHRPGANGIIAAEATAKAPADGYTLMIVSSAHVINPLLLPTSYDALKDFAAVATNASSELLLVVHPSVPANNVRELIALAKARPAQLNYASSGSGNINHLSAEMFNMIAGVRTQHIPYKGIGPALTELMGGQVQLLFTPPIAVIPQIKSGKLKPIAISGDTRLSALPQVPTFAEGGLRNFELRYWFGILAPARTPNAIIAKLSGEITKILAMADIKENLFAQGMDTFASTPEQFAALMKADTAKFAKVVSTAGIKLNE